MKEIILQGFGFVFVLLLAFGLGLYAKPKSGYVDFVEELCYKHRVTDACDVIQGKKKKECK
jgi:hypothetical protein